MSRSFRLLAAGMLVPTIAFGQGRSTAEIGTNLGLTIQSVSGASLTMFGIPGEGILGQPSIYYSFFTTGGLLIEPQVAINVLSSGGNTITTAGLGGQIGKLFNGAETSSTFISGTFGYQTISGAGTSANDVGFGARVGYRMVVGTGLGVRLEAGIRRWLDSELNEITIGLGLGGIIRSSS